MLLQTGQMHIITMASERSKPRALGYKYHQTTMCTPVGPRPSVAVENLENFNLDNFAVGIKNRFDIDLAETHSSDIVGFGVSLCHPSEKKISKA